MLNIIYFNETYNFIYGLLIILIISGISLQSYGEYKKTGQKKFAFFGIMFLISGLFELMHILLIFNNEYIEFFNVFLNRLYQCIGLIGIIFMKDSAENEKITPKDYFLYFGSFILIFILECSMINLKLTQEFFPNLLNSITTFIFISLLSSFILIEKNKGKPIFNKFNLGLLFLGISSIYIINPTYYVSLYRHFVHLFRLIGNLLIFLGFNTIKQNFQPYRLRLHLILLSNLYMIIFFIVFIMLGNILFDLNFSNEIYASFILFYIICLCIQSIFVSKSTEAITYITQSLTKFNPNEKPQPLKVTQGNEIGILAENINKFSETQWKYTQEIKNKQIQIQELMDSRDSFIAALSHDLKSPIFAEQKLIESVLMDKESIKIENLIEYLEDMYKINDEVLRIVNNLLTTYHLDAKKLELNYEDSNINAIIENAKNTLKHLAKDEKIELYLELTPNIPKINMDKDMISRVMTNLISNAIKHSKSSSRIDIKSKLTENYVQISIQDYGKGIPQEEKPKIFQKYPGAKRTVGTGLGLYISKQIIDAHKGKIWFESETGKGTTFYFSLPIK